MDLPPRLTIEGIELETLREANYPKPITRPTPNQLLFSYYICQKEQKTNLTKKEQIFWYNIYAAREKGRIALNLVYYIY